MYLYNERNTQQNLTPTKKIQITEKKIINMEY